MKEKTEVVKLWVEKLQKGDHLLNIGEVKLTEEYANGYMIHIVDKDAQFFEKHETVFIQK